MCDIIYIRCDFFFLFVVIRILICYIFPEICLQLIEEQNLLKFSKALFVKASGQALPIKNCIKELLRLHMQIKFQF